MPSILTQCPRCQTSFKVSDRQLAIAEGFVRCGSCLDVFSATANRITIKQPVSTALFEDLPADFDDADEEVTEQPLHESNTAADVEATETPSMPASATAPAAFDLSHSVTLKYPVGQLIDADDVVPVNVVGDTRPSSLTNPDSGFVFDDDIPLGDMVLDDDPDEGDELEADHDDEPETAEVAEDSDETIVLELDEEFTATGAAPGFDNDGGADQQLNPDLAAPVAPQADTEGVAGAIQEARAANSRQLESEPAFSLALREERAEIASSAAQPTDQGTVTEAEAAPASLQHPPDGSDTDALASKAEAAEERGPDAQKQSVTDPTADALFRSIYASPSSDGVEPALDSEPLDQTPNTPVNQEALYEAYAAGIPAEAGAEEPNEILTQGFAANRDDGSNPDAEESFTAANLSATDEGQVDGFSALAAVAADEAEELVDLPPKTPSRYEKEELRQYLAHLEDADALEPLPATTVDAIEAEPLTLEAGHSFRKFMGTFAWSFLSLVLATVFVFQVVASNLELMQESPTYSRYLPLFCRVLDCPEPVPDAAAIQSLASQDLLVRSHPRIPGALEVSFIFRNDADFPQPFPLVELNFRNSASQLIANRLFTPEEYLPPELAELDMMPARSSVQVMLELVDPGSEAVDYEIVFRDPAQESLNDATEPARTPQQ